MPPPPCDRHKSLEMVPLGQTLIDVCPVLSCGRCHDEQGYFEVMDGELLRGQIAAPSRLVQREQLQMSSDLETVVQIANRVDIWYMTRTANCTSCGHPTKVVFKHPPKCHKQLFRGGGVALPRDSIPGRSPVRIN